MVSKGKVIFFASNFKREARSSSDTAGVRRSSNVPVVNAQFLQPACSAFIKGEFDFLWPTL
jgi:hypothetical protein